MKNFWKIVNKVIFDADVLLLVLDARLIEETRNKEIEDRILSHNKPLIYVVTKCDLVSKESIEKYKSELKPLIFISATEFLGVNKLREKIIIEGKRIGKEKVKVGVLGYPNVGKSSLVNAMNGRHSASTSSNSGQTKGVQLVKESARIMFLDTPGVIPYLEKDEIKHAMTSSIDFNKAKDPDVVVAELIEKFPGVLELHYNVKKSDDIDDVIEEIALKMKILKKGGLPDIERAARAILKDWQTGMINQSDRKK
jgi:ribosome biogenesis GTPase A